MARTSRCRDCGLDVLWIHTRDGKRMPVDPFPDESGNIAARPYGVQYVDAHVIRDGKSPAGYRVFMPHFATCLTRRKAREAARKAAPQPQPTLLEVEEINHGR